MSEAQVRERTPQNLDELVQVLVSIAGFTQINREGMKSAIRDYLANRFNPALLSASNPNEIEELFEHCTREAK